MDSRNIVLSMLGTWNMVTFLFWFKKLNVNCNDNAKNPFQSLMLSLYVVVDFKGKVRHLLG